MNASFQIAKRFKLIFDGKSFFTIIGRFLILKFETFLNFSLSSLIEENFTQGFGGSSKKRRGAGANFKKMKRKERSGSQLLKKQKPDSTRLLVLCFD